MCLRLQIAIAVNVSMHMCADLCARLCGLLGRQDKDFPIKIS